MARKDDLMGGESQAGQPPKLLAQVRELLRVRRYAWRTERAYCDWIRRYVKFHGKRHPRELGAAEAGYGLVIRLLYGTGLRVKGCF